MKNIHCRIWNKSFFEILFECFMLFLITRNILNEANVSLENGIAQNLPQWSTISPVYLVANEKRYHHQKDLSEEDDFKRSR